MLPVMRGMRDKYLCQGEVRGESCELFRVTRTDKKKHCVMRNALVHTNVSNNTG